MKLDRAKLQRAREMLGYGIETTAAEAGVSKNSVLRAEHEEDIRPVTARKIAAALGVRVADLIGESETLKAPAAGPPEWLRPQIPIEELSDEDLADVRRLLGGGKPGARFVEDDSAWLRELYAFFEQEAARRSAQPALPLGEDPEPPAQRFSLLAEAIVTVVARWMQITARTDSRKTFGIVEAALDLEDQISTLLGDERRSLSRRERSEITHIMGLLEEVARRHIARMEAELDQEPPADLEEFRLRKEQLREVRRRVSVTSA